MELPFGSDLLDDRQIFRALISELLRPPSPSIRQRIDQSEIVIEVFTIFDTNRCKRGIISD